MDATSAYRKTDTQGKSQLDLVIQVYDGALDAYREAKDCYQRENFQEGYERLEKGKRFLVHLFTTLDFDRGGEVAQQLGQLYSFCINETNVLEATKETAKIDDIINVLNNLREGWSGLRRQQAESGQTPPQPSADGPKANSEQFVTSA